MMVLPSLLTVPLFAALVERAANVTTTGEFYRPTHRRYFGECHPDSNLINGQGFEKFVSIPKGEPDNFVSEEGIRAKFAGLWQSNLNEQDANKSATSILALEEANSVSSFMAFARSQCILSVCLDNTRLT